MTRRSTSRLVTAFILSLGGVAAAIIAGLAEVAVLVAPWFIASAIAFSRGLDPAPRISVRPTKRRMMMGDQLELEVELNSATDAFIEVTPVPIQRYRDRQPVSEPITGQTELVQPGRPSRLHLPLDLGEWGTWDLGQGAVSVRDPLGFFRLEGSISRRTEVRVHPKTERLRELVRPRAVRRVTGFHPSRSVGRGVEYADIRQFHSGDSLRDINWRASARSAELQVSDRHPDRGADVLLLLDSFVESGHDTDRVLGMAVRAALAVSRGHLGVTDRVGLIEFGGVVRWVEPGSGAVQLHRLTDALLASSLFANAAAKELPSLPARIWSPRAVVLALSPLLDERFVDAVIAARSRGHDVALIECTPFEAEGPMSAEESVSLRLWHAERSVVRDRLLEHGVAVTPWHPDEPVEAALATIALLRRRVQVPAR